MTLYIVPTPIGNLEDITLRALRILKEVAVILAEDTRTTRVLLDRYEIITPMISYHEHNEAARIEDVLDMLSRGDVALVSDAGTPGLSDPGYELIDACVKAEAHIVPLPGAMAGITALVASGMPLNRFTFLGFLPRKKHALHTLLIEFQNTPHTLVGYESPYRLNDTLEAIGAVLGDQRPVCVAREMTKKFEEFFRGTAAEALDYFSSAPVRGEVTLIIGGSSRSDEEWSETEVREALRGRLATGESRNKAAKAIAAESGWHKRDIYQMEL